MIILNIGLDNNPHTIPGILLMLDNLKAYKTSSQLYQKDDGEMVRERTLVVYLDHPVAEHRLFHVANACGQDCIAQYDTHNQVGELIGPRCAPYGEFNLDYFIQ